MYEGEPDTQDLVLASPTPSGATCWVQTGTFHLLNSTQPRCTGPSRPNSKEEGTSHDSPEPGLMSLLPDQGIYLVVTRGG